jgi:multiple sugar transport system ATP-binding protein
VDLGAGDGVPVVVDVVEQLGSDAYLYATLGAADDGDVLHTADLVVRTEPRSAPAVGEPVTLRVREDHLHVFDPVTQLRVD